MINYLQVLEKIQQTNSSKEKEQLLKEQKKECNKCKKQKELKDFPKDNRIKSGFSGRCKLCITSYQKIWYKDFYPLNKERLQEKQRNNPKKAAAIKKHSRTPKGRFIRLKSKAKSKNIEFTLTYFEYENLFKMNSVCFYCEDKLMFQTGGMLDRLDPKLGYLLSNVQPCCFICNSVKSDIFTATEMKLLIGPIIKKIKEERRETGNFMEYTRRIKQRTFDLKERGDFTKK